jgi:hypothetical protein
VASNKKQFKGIINLEVIEQKLKDKSSYMSAQNNSAEAQSQMQTWL